MSGGRTTKPCPGCGKVDRFRKPDEVCRDCKEALVEAARYRKLAQERTAAGEAYVRYGAAVHWNKTVHVHGVDTDPVNLALFDLAQAVVVRSERQGKNPQLLLGEYHCDVRWVYGNCPVPVAEAIIRLHKTLQPLLDATYNAGVLRGADLLRRLNAGELSPVEFAEAKEKCRK